MSASPPLSNLDECLRRLRLTNDRSEILCAVCGGGGGGTDPHGRWRRFLNFETEFEISNVVGYHWNPDTEANAEVRGGIYPVGPTLVGAICR